MAHWISLESHIDDRGELYVLENGLGFSPQRTYFIRKVPAGIERGFHRHKKTVQILFCPVGACCVAVKEQGHSKDFLLDNPQKALYLKPEDWHYMHSFTPDCVLLVLASERYDPDDYILESP